MISCGTSQQKGTLLSGGGIEHFEVKDHGVRLFYREGIVECIYFTICQWGRMSSKKRGFKRILAHFD
jgi:hypothetical protein